jgi:hypothetical protein
MKINTQTRRIAGTWKTGLAAAGLCGLTALPLVGAGIPAQADSRQGTFTHRDRNDDDDCDDRTNNGRWGHDRGRHNGRWNRDRDRDRNDNGRWDYRDRDRNNGRWGNDDRDRDRYGTISGVVTDKKSDQRFTMRANGRTYDVYSTERLPRRLDRGDRVRVTGRIDDDNINASDIDVTDNR